MALMISEVFKGKAKVGETVTIRGWVRNRRDSKAGFSFIVVHDGSCFDGLQVVAGTGLANYQNDVMKLTTGCSLEVTGELVASAGKGQSVEIQAKEVKVSGWVEDPEKYPVAAKQHTFEYLREVAHLRARTNTFGAMARMRDAVAWSIQQFFRERGFLWVHTPIITSSDCEGAGEMFRVSTLDLANLPKTEGGGIDYTQDFFGKPTFLTVSGQLNVETYCLALSKVYTFGPTFRAEKSTTTRHLAEFWMVEPEVAFADLNADADLAEEFLRAIAKGVLEQRADDMKFFAERIDKECIARVEKLATAKFIRMEYTEAVDILLKSGKKFEYEVKWGAGFQSEHEKYLTDVHCKCPVIVVNYPKEVKSFYMRVNDDGKTVAAMDVLVPGLGEIIGGSQREDRLDVMDRRLEEMGMDKALYNWYRDLRKYGTVSHAGFGLGFERMLLYVTGMANIRDAIPFPRTFKNAGF